MLVIKTDAKANCNGKKLLVPAGKPIKPLLLLKFQTVFLLQDHCMTGVVSGGLW